MKMYNDETLKPCSCIKKMNKKKDKSILVFRFSALGDIAMTIPVLRSFF
jgi:hypothetical protein